VGTLFSSFDIARLGMQAAQVQMDTAAHNIANVNREGYSRQRVNLTTPFPSKHPYGQVGRGVLIQDIRRVRDEFLDKIYRDQIHGLGASDIRAQYYRLLEDNFLEPTGEGLGVRINDFFDTLNDYANNVEEAPVREAMIAEAENLAVGLNQFAGRMYDLRTNANEEIRNIVPEINSLLERIYQTNIQIRDSELDNSVANDIRDERDRALDELARLININYTEAQDGQITVRVGPDVLVDMTGWREIITPFNNALDPERGDLLEVRFADNNLLLPIEEGELAAVLEMRDEVLPYFDERIDTVTATMIGALNRIHAQSNGLANITGLIDGDLPVSDPNVPLVSAGLPFDIDVPGNFDVAIYSGGVQVAGSPFTVNVDATTTLNDLVAQLNGIAPGTFTASVNPDNTLRLGTPGAGDAFVFSNDTTGALAALGVQGLFEGFDARTIAINPDLLDDPLLLGSAYSLDPDASGDNRAALDLAGVRNDLLLSGGAATLNDYYESTIAELGVDSRANDVFFETQQEFINDFQRRRLEESGVSLDEEVTFMIEYERAFQAAARVITTVERMLDSLFTIGA
jgi:flagellar hook-associated protein 1 FlgK